MTKNQEFLRVSQERTPTIQGGGVLQRAAEAYVWKVNVSRLAARSRYWIPFRELAGKPLIRIANRKLDWILGVSTDRPSFDNKLSCP